VYAEPPARPVPYLGDALNPSIAEQIAARRNRRVDLPAPGEPTVLTLHVAIDGSEPAIWRRVQIRGDLTLDRLHTCLQTALGWTNSHLHRFGAAGVDPWSPPWFVSTYDEEEFDEEGTPESEVRLDQVLQAVGDWLVYTYDFGDDWVHRVEVEDVRAADEGDPPARCLAGVGACPPEDVGGIPTWNELAAALRADPDPAHLPDELADYADWLPPGLHPDAFDLSAVNSQLATLEAALNLPLVHPVLQEMLDRSGPELRGELTGMLVAAAQCEISRVSDEEWATLLRPWQALLDEADPDGIPLTAASWITPAACERILQNSGLKLTAGKGNREQNTPIYRLRETAMVTRLVRRIKGRLMLTPLGRKAVRDPRILRGCVARYLIEAGDDFDQESAALTLLLAASGWTPTGEGSQDKTAEVARLLTELGWQTSSPFGFRYGVEGSSRVQRWLTHTRPSRAAGSDAYADPAAPALAHLAIFPGS